MKRMIDYIPESAKFDVDGLYNDLWNSVYNTRRKKVNEDKAVHSASAAVYAKALRDFINKG